MRIAIRTDSSLDIGSGHLQRCLALAIALRQTCKTVVFVCRDLPGNLCALVERNGFELAKLPAPDGMWTGSGDQSDLPAHAPWLGVDWRQDAAETAAALADRGRWQWLVVDHYALDRRWEKELRPVAERLMVIDDLADRTHDCDLILDQNLQSHPCRYRDLASDECVRLLGPRFALLRPEFVEERDRLRERKGIVRRILLFFGGTDQQDMTGFSLDAICALDDAKLSVDVVIGAANPNKQRLQTRCKYRDKWYVHIQISNMAQLIAAADLAIGAAGATSWERCCLGLPAVVYALAPNQVAIAEELAARGCALYLGQVCDRDHHRLVSVLEGQISEPTKLRQMTARCLSLVDGNGPQRVVKHLVHA